MNMAEYVRAARVIAYLSRALSVHNRDKNVC